ncbi:MAG TPA: lipoyl(octanoyl) transferase LipB [Burkholderiaceae bacterium]|nr:lipoyl(octanoyl) transferase LipB [Burkholderiaceae bacterium]
MLIRHLGRCDWQATADAMRAFTEARGERTPDELWLAEHEPVFTQGVAGRAEHVHGAGAIQVRASNRGGQVTYHGPGQVVAYPLLDLRRQHIYVKEYVFRIEAAVLKVLESYGVTGHRVAGAPGLYVRLDDPFGHAALAGPADPREPFRGLGKIAALGIKVSRHCTYHGVALNVAMDLEPFTRIDPCGYAGLATVDLARLGVPATWREAADRLAQRLVGQFTP